MDRLTYRDENGKATRAPMSHAFQVLEKLARYEDAEEQGRLIVLPCKVEDTVWYIPSGTRKIYSGICHCVSIQKGGVNIHLYDFDGDAATYPASRVYFTREEAEAALGGADGAI